MLLDGEGLNAVNERISPIGDVSFSFTVLAAAPTPPAHTLPPRLAAINARTPPLTTFAYTP